MSMKKNWTKVTIETQVDPGWIDFLLNYNDIFKNTFYAGYWLAGVAHTRARGWLVWEHNDESVHDTKHTEALKAWRAGKPLPAGYHRLDRAAAIKAWCEGVKRWGSSWYDEGDGPRYEVAVQLALLGEEKYG